MNVTVIVTNHVNNGAKCLPHRFSHSFSHSTYRQAMVWTQKGTRCRSKSVGRWLPVSLQDGGWAFVFPGLLQVDEIAFSFISELKEEESFTNGHNLERSDNIPDLLKALSNSIGPILLLIAKRPMRALSGLMVSLLQMLMTELSISESESFC